MPGLTRTKSTRLAATAASMAAKSRGSMRKRCPGRAADRYSAVGAQARSVAASPRWLRTPMRISRSGSGW